MEASLLSITVTACGSSGISHLTLSLRDYIIAGIPGLAMTGSPPANGGGRTQVGGYSRSPERLELSSATAGAPTPARSKSPAQRSTTGLAGHLPPRNKDGRVAARVLATLGGAGRHPEPGLLLRLRVRAGGRASLSAGAAGLSVQPPPRPPTEERCC